MNTADILNRRVTFCPNIRTKSLRSITLFEALNTIRKEIYTEQISNIRKLALSNDTVKVKAKKKQLPAYIFSGLAYGGRYKFDISGYTSLLIVDIDNPKNPEHQKAKLQADPYVISIWESPSGNGLKALFYIQYEDVINAKDIWVVHEHCAFPQIEKYLLHKHDIQIDKSGGDITRLCFVSSDPNIHLKNQFEPFIVQKTLTSNQIHRIRAKYNYGTIGRCKAIKEMKRFTAKLSDNVISEPVTADIQHTPLASNTSSD